MIAQLITVRLLVYNLFTRSDNKALGSVKEYTRQSVTRVNVKGLVKKRFNA